MDWCTIESDPGVFTELIHSLGCTDVQLEEVISLDSLPAETLGLVFLFKFKKELYANDTRHGISSEANRSVYFAKQTIQNACATHCGRLAGGRCGGWPKGPMRGCQVWRTWLLLQRPVRL